MIGQVVEKLVARLAKEKKKLVGWWKSRLPDWTEKRGN